MFRAEPLVKAQLWILASETPDVALELARFGVFSPAPGAPAALSELSAEGYREAWQEANARLSKLLEQCGDSGPLTVPDRAAAPALDDLLELNAWLKEVWSTCLACHESEARIEEEKKHLDALEETLGKLERLNVDLASLLRPDSLLAVNIGSLPAASVKRLTEALSMTGYLVSRFDQVGDQAFAVIAGPRHRHDEVRGLLAQAGWRELPVPEELRTHPQAARNWLEAERRRLEDRDGAACQTMYSLRDQFGPRLHEARLRLLLARPLADAAQTAVRGKGGLAVLVGWIPRRNVTALRETLQARFQGRYWLDLREPLAQEAREVPSLMRYPGWLVPFAPLVESYGVPRYGEFDPVLPFALLYLLLFGAMFGDVGHGGTILVLALVMLPRIGLMAWVGMAAGLVSMLFGLLYGSVFGYENILQPIWISPLHDPLRVLTLAIALGVGFIVLTLLLNVGNQWKAGQVARALFDTNGLAGLVFYLGVVGGMSGLAGVTAIGQSAWSVASMGLGVALIYKGFETRGSVGERILVTVIELLESGISLFSNTLSFMRVAAFSLNHVALTMAIFTLASGLSLAAHGLTVVLGNIVIVALEGGVVAIQALRLLYYEGFSRFFSGDGIAFIPLRLIPERGRIEPV